MTKKHTDEWGSEELSVDSTRITTRRDFLRVLTRALSGLAIAPLACCRQGNSAKVTTRFGIVTDSHYANADPRGTRYYRESLQKMRECVDLMNRESVNFLVELGDFKDQDSAPDEGNTLSYLQTIEKVFQGSDGSKYHVLGNHDFDSISKSQFLKIVQNTGIVGNSTYYSFDLRGTHFVVLDANFKADGSDYDHGNFEWTDTNIPPEELNWLQEDLVASSRPTIVFIHQQLDRQGAHCVNNAAEVRQVLQRSGEVCAVFQGHYHPGHYSQVDGIHYYTLKAMVEGSGSDQNAYAIVDVREDGSIAVTGYRRAVSKELA